MIYTASDRNARFLTMEPRRDYAFIAMMRKYHIDQWMYLCQLPGNFVKGEALDKEVEYHLEQTKLYEQFMWDHEGNFIPWLHG